jgi:Fe2+ transport system protein FeoA
LDALQRGDAGHIERLTLPATQATRLAGMGLCEGRLIEVVSRGDPMIVRVCGSTLALGKRAARGVELCVCGAPSCPGRREAHSDAELLPQSDGAAGGTPPPLAGAALHAAKPDESAPTTPAREGGEA